MTSVPSYIFFKFFVIINVFLCNYVDRSIIVAGSIPLLDHMPEEFVDGTVPLFFGALTDQKLYNIFLQVENVFLQQVVPDDFKSAVVEFLNKLPHVVHL